MRRQVKVVHFFFYLLLFPHSLYFLVDYLHLSPQFAVTVVPLKRHSRKEGFPCFLEIKMYTLFKAFQNVAFSRESLWILRVKMNNLISTYLLNWKWSLKKALSFLHRIKRIPFWRSGKYKYPFITPRSTLMRCGSIFGAPSLGQIDLSKIIGLEYLITYHCNLFVSRIMM